MEDRLEGQKAGRLEDQKVDHSLEDRKVDWKVDHSLEGQKVNRLEDRKVDHSLEDRKVDPMVGRMEGQKVNQMADRLVACSHGAGFEIRREREAGLMEEGAVLLP
jgi:hypothetical protein